MTLQSVVSLYITMFTNSGPDSSHFYDYKTIGGITGVTHCT